MLVGVHAWKQSVVVAVEDRGHIPKKRLGVQLLVTLWFRTQRRLLNLHFLLFNTCTGHFHECIPCVIVNVCVWSFSIYTVWPKTVCHRKQVIHTGMSRHRQLYLRYYKKYDIKWLKYIANQTQFPKHTEYYWTHSVCPIMPWPLIIKVDKFYNELITSSKHPRSAVFDQTFRTKLWQKRANCLLRAVQKCRPCALAVFIPPCLTGQRQTDYRLLCQSPSWVSPGEFTGNPPMRVSMSP